MRRDIRKFLYIIPEGVKYRDTQDFFVRTFFIPHFKQAYRLCLNYTSGECRLPYQYKCIKRVSIQCKGFRDESVITGIMHGRKEHPVKLNPLLFFIVFIFISAPLRDFYHYSNRCYFFFHCPFISRVICLSIYGVYTIYKWLSIIWLGLGSISEGRRSEEHTSELQSQFHLVCRL